MRRIEVRVVKFGGSTVGDPGRLRAAVEMVGAIARSPCLIVASAPAGWTDQLLGISRFGAARFRSDAEARVLGTAEQVGGLLLSAALEAAGHPVRLLLPTDPDWPLHLREGGSATSIDWERSRTAFRRLFEGTEGPRSIVMPGFIGLDGRGRLRTLARGGGDATAVVAARCLGSLEVTLVKDVPGLFDADPRVVPGSRPIVEATVEELTTLASAGTRLVAAEALRYLAADQRLLIVGIGAPLDGTSGSVIRRAASPAAEGGDPAEDDGADDGALPLVGPGEGDWALVTALPPGPTGSDDGGPGVPGGPGVRVTPVHLLASLPDAERVVRALHSTRSYRALAHRRLARDPAPTSPDAGNARTTIRPADLLAASGDDPSARAVQEGGSSGGP